jgi:hypothetical protein
LRHLRCPATTTTAAAVEALALTKEVQKENDVFQRLQLTITR